MNTPTAENGFGDEFDDFEEGAEAGADDDFGDFDYGFEEPPMVEDVKAVAAPEPPTPLFVSSILVKPASATCLLSRATSP